MVIKLSNGESAIVDAEDYSRLSQWKWRFSHGYAIRSVWLGHGKETTRSMHREILNLTDPRIQTDHRNLNKLDNRRENLRPASHVENQRNTKPTGRSPFKGVNWDRSNRHWQARIKLDTKRIFLGSFKSEIDAAKAYDEAAMRHFGEFARTNF
jgi:hypothetical protein